MLPSFGRVYSTFPYSTKSGQAQVQVGCLIVNLDSGYAHLFLFSNESIECSHRLFVHVITLGIRGESARLDIGEEALQCLGSHIRQVSVLAYELGNPAIIHAQHIVKHKYLSITMWSCTNTNRRYRYFLCNHLR